MRLTFLDFEIIIIVNNIFLILFYALYSAPVYLNVKIPIENFRKIINYIAALFFSP